MDLKRFFKGFGYAFQGIATALRGQQNIWFQLFCGLVVVVAGLIIGLERWEWVAITLTIAMVIAAELFNSSIEHLTDLASPEIHPIAKKVKDIAAGAVLVTAIASVVVAALIFGSRLCC